MKNVLYLISVMALLSMILFSSPYEEQYLKGSRAYDSDSIAFGIIISFVLLSVHGAYLFVGIYINNKGRYVLKQINTYFFIFYFIAFFYWLHYILVA